MTSYNVYIGTLAIWKKAFFTELLGLEFFSEYLGAVTKMKNDFTWEIKERSNKQITGWSKVEIDNQARLVHNDKAVKQDGKASQEAAFKTIG